MVLAFEVGNTNSRVAHQHGDDRPDLIAAECGNRLIKSYVTFEADGSHVVGSASYRIAQRNPAATVHGIASRVAEEGAVLKYSVADKPKQSAVADVYGTLLGYLKNIGETVSLSVNEQS